MNQPHGFKQTQKLAEALKNVRSFTSTTETDLDELVSEGNDIGDDFGDDLLDALDENDTDIDAPEILFNEVNGIANNLFDPLTENGLENLNGTHRDAPDMLINEANDIANSLLDTLTDSGLESLNHTDQDAEEKVVNEANDIGNSLLDSRKNVFKGRNKADQDKFIDRLEAENEQTDGNFGENLFLEELVEPQLPQPNHPQFPAISLVTAKKGKTSSKVVPKLDTDLTSFENVAGLVYRQAKRSSIGAVDCVVSPHNISQNELQKTSPVGKMKHGKTVSNIDASGLAVGVPVGRVRRSSTWAFGKTNRIGVFTGVDAFSSQPLIPSTKSALFGNLQQTRSHNRVLIGTAKHLRTRVSILDEWSKANLLPKFAFILVLSVLILYAGSQLVPSTYGYVYVCAGLLCVLASILGICGVLRVANDIQFDVAGMETFGQHLLQTYFHTSLGFVLVLCPLSVHVLTNIDSITGSSDVDPFLLQMASVVSIINSLVMLLSLRSVALIVTLWEISHSFLESAGTFVAVLGVLGVVLVTSFLNYSAFLSSTTFSSPLASAILVFLGICVVLIASSLLGFGAAYFEIKPLLLFHSIFTAVLQFALFVTGVLLASIDVQELIESNCREVMQIMSYSWFDNIVGCTKYGALSGKVEAYGRDGFEYSIVGVGESASCPSKETHAYAWEYGLVTSERSSRPVMLEGCLQLACCDVLSEHIMTHLSLLVDGFIVLLIVLAIVSLGDLWLHKHAHDHSARVKTVSTRHACTMLAIFFLSAIAAFGGILLLVWQPHPIQISQLDIRDILDRNVTTPGLPAEEPSSSCFNSKQDGNESGVDCGGSCDAACAAFSGCVVDTDCTSGYCNTTSAECRAETPFERCSNGVRDGHETDVDCGGEMCSTLHVELLGSISPNIDYSRLYKCSLSKLCSVNSDCVSGMCDKGVCIGCSDGLKNGDEGDVDCGSSKCVSQFAAWYSGEDISDLFLSEPDPTSGNISDPGYGELISVIANYTTRDSRGLCLNGRTCSRPDQCSSGVCVDGVCSSCSNWVQDGDETDLDCGGRVCMTRCQLGQGCYTPFDCMSGICSTNCATGECIERGTCMLGPLDPLDPYVDLSTVLQGCSNGFKDGRETDIDCGGGNCNAVNITCPDGGGCTYHDDCESGECHFDSNTCVSCFNEVQDGSETDVDCGGEVCAQSCEAQSGCENDLDCSSDLFCWTIDHFGIAEQSILNALALPTDFFDSVNLPLPNTCQAVAEVEARVRSYPQILDDDQVFYGSLFDTHYNNALQLVGPVVEVLSERRRLKASKKPKWPAFYDGDSQEGRWPFCCPVKVTSRVSEGSAFEVLDKRGVKIKLKSDDTVMTFTRDILSFTPEVIITPLSCEDLQSISVTTELEVGQGCEFVSIPVTLVFNLIMPLRTMIIGQVKKSSCQDENRENEWSTTDACETASSAIEGAVIRVTGVRQGVCSTNNAAIANDPNCMTSVCEAFGSTNYDLCEKHMPCCKWDDDKNSDKKSNKNKNKKEPSRCVGTGLSDTSVKGMSDGLGRFTAMWPEFTADNSLLPYQAVVHVFADGYLPVTVDVTVTSASKLVLGAPVYMMVQPPQPCECVSYLNGASDVLTKFCREVVDAELPSTVNCYPVPSDSGGCAGENSAWTKCDNTLTFPPTGLPSKIPTNYPSIAPNTRSPTLTPSLFPTHIPNKTPSTVNPSHSPSIHPTQLPSITPSASPSLVPTHGPIYSPSKEPSVAPSINPTDIPTEFPTSTPSRMPSVRPTNSPTQAPSTSPSQTPSTVPTNTPSVSPSEIPTQQPTSPDPSEIPSSEPSRSPSDFPSSEPSRFPTSGPTFEPTVSPTIASSPALTLGLPVRGTPAHGLINGGESNWNEIQAIAQAFVALVDEISENEPGSEFDTVYDIQGSWLVNETILFPGLGSIWEGSNNASKSNENSEKQTDCLMDDTYMTTDPMSPEYSLQEFVNSLISVRCEFLITNCPLGSCVVNDVSGCGPTAVIMSYSIPLSCGTIWDVGTDPTDVNFVSKLSESGVNSTWLDDSLGNINSTHINVTNLDVSLRIEVTPETPEVFAAEIEQLFSHIYVSTIEATAVDQLGMFAGSMSVQGCEIHECMENGACFTQTHMCTCDDGWDGYQCSVVVPTRTPTQFPTSNPTETDICEGQWVKVFEQLNPCNVILDLGESQVNALFRDRFRYDIDGTTYAYYLRTSVIPDGFSIYKQMLDWTNIDNVLNTDFELYSTAGELHTTSEKWQYCNYNDADIGFPRDCGRTEAVKYKWAGAYCLNSWSAAASFSFHVCASSALPTRAPTRTPILVVPTTTVSGVVYDAELEVGMPAVVSLFMGILNQVDDGIEPIAEILSDLNFGPTSDLALVVMSTYSQCKSEMNDEMALTITNSSFQFADIPQGVYTIVVSDQISGTSLETQLEDNGFTASSFQTKMITVYAGENVPTVRIPVGTQLLSSQLRIVLEYKSIPDIDLVVTFRVSDSSEEECVVSGKTTKDNPCGCGDAVVTRDDTGLDSDGIGRDIITLNRIHQTVYRFTMTRVTPIKADVQTINWRTDGRCGSLYPLSNGEKSRCPVDAILWDDDTIGSRPCCSDTGYCGATARHCECRRCVDYREFVNDDWQQDFRADGRCRNKFHKAPDGDTAHCPTEPVAWNSSPSSSPNGDESRPCCSRLGRCGTTVKDCNCVGCLDYRMFTNVSTFDSETLESEIPTEISGAVIKVYNADGLVQEFKLPVSPYGTEHYFDGHVYDGVASKSARYARLFCINGKSNSTGLPPQLHSYPAPQYFQWEGQMLDMDANNCPGTNDCNYIDVVGFTVNPMLNGRYLERYSRQSPFQAFPGHAVSTRCHVRLYDPENPSTLLPKTVRDVVDVNYCLDICLASGSECEGVYWWEAADQDENWCVFYNNNHICGGMFTSGATRFVYEKVQVIAESEIWYTKLDTLFGAQGTDANKAIHLYRVSGDSGTTFEWYFDHDLRATNGYLGLGIDATPQNSGLPDGVTTWASSVGGNDEKGSQFAVEDSRKVAFTEFSQACAHGANAPTLFSALKAAKCVCGPSTTSVCNAGGGCTTFPIRYENTDICLGRVPYFVVLQLCDPHDPFQQWSVSTEGSFHGVGVPGAQALGGNPDLTRVFAVKIPSNPFDSGFMALEDSEFGVLEPLYVTAATDRTFRDKNNQCLYQPPLVGWRAKFVPDGSQVPCSTFQLY